MASFCEECSDSIGDKHCVDCDRYFCLNCKLTHLSVGKFPTHSFHNVEPVKERGPIENDSQTQRKADTLIKPGVVMADLDIENLPHNYGDSEKNVDNTDWDGKQKDATQISTENKTDTVVKSDTVSTKSESSSNKAEKPKEVTNETFDQASEPVNSKIVPDKPDDKKETNKPSSAQIKPTANTDSIPDVISDTEKDKRIFELTETEKIKEPNKSHEIVTTDKTNEESKNYRSEKTAYSILEVTSMCNDHNEEDFIFICDRCDVPVCKICVVREHKGHKLSDIEETATMRENALAHVLTPRIAGAVRNSSEMSLNLSTFDSEINEVNRAIERHGQSIKELVDRQVELMIKNVKERAGRRKNKYSDVNDTLNDAVVKGKLLQQRHQDLTKSKNDGALILQLKKLSKDATNFHYPSVPNFPTVKYHPPKVTEGDVEALFGAFSFIDMDPRSNRLPKMIPPANIYSTPKHRWQCCRCGTDQLNDTSRIYNNNLFFDCAKCRRNMYHVYRGKVYE